jgi:S-adenosylmethionine decarboxylase
MKQVRELLADLYGCEGELDDVEFLKGVLKAAAQQMKSKIIKVVSHRFSPTGITVILILAETHISIHTWPEHNYAALDIFICSQEVDPEVGWQAVREALNPSSFKVHKLKRRIQ